MGNLSRMTMLGASIYMLYKYRYRLANVVLSNTNLRRYLIKATMGIPFLRSRLIQYTFRS